ncbi:uncharacterized protein Lmpt isoform X2 [Chelonus insularis]|uniref:uncharacterized protein Lmpt isoform X2 n=1 Tax=Chelonus insularis TaxID=460826 RepID=UPI00158D61CD|nr:uncharacterized protein LOC118068033 isoform X2 [Chelonus insularis]
MGLLLSILVGCVGAIELLACLKHVTDDVKLSPAPSCLSYHSPVVENPSFHDSICDISHSSDIKIPRSARSKLENLHEYSLRVRSELRSHGYGDGSTLSDFSSQDLRSMSRTDSRFSLDFELIEKDAEESERWGEIYDVTKDDKISMILMHHFEADDEQSEDQLVIEEIFEPNEKHVQQVYHPKIIKPIPLSYSQKYSNSDSESTDVGTGFDNDSGNELPTREHFKNIHVVVTGQNHSPLSHYSGESSGFFDDLEKKVNIERIESTSGNHSASSSACLQDELNENIGLSVSERKSGERGTSPISHSIQKRNKTIRGSSILRKPTRLKSRNAEVSKSAENLSVKKSKRQREPERRKSDISIQTTSSESFRDEWTNTSPTDSERSISASRSSVSVQVQTNFEFDLDVFKNVRSESKKDSSIKNGKKSFITKRFPKSRSLDDHNINKEFIDYNGLQQELISLSNNNKLSNDEYSRVELATPQNSLRYLNAQGSEEDSLDEEFLDAEDNSSSQSGPIEYCIPNVEANQAFWLIFSGEYTKAMNKDWHSGHFCCWQCDESLTGQRYVLRDEHPYCIKCYESVFANGCEECNKIIGIDSKDLSYKDKHWHEACFLCNKCRVSLVDKQFGSKVDKIYCGNCYDAQFASRCDGCGEIFRAGTKKMEYKTRQWHEKCFCCVVCKNPIGTKSFIPREQEIYCASCYEDKFATRCVKCNKIITSGGVTYKQEPWHRDCFTCSHCNNSLAGQRFTSRDDKPYCAECFGELFAKRCTACSKPITGIGGTRFISFEDRHWHNDCFICAGCNTSLVGRGFITDGDDIICPECAKQKLSE